MNFDKIEQQADKSSSQTFKNKTIVDVPEWADLGKVNVIKQWTDEIIDAKEASLSVDDWKLIGTAVTVIHDDVEFSKKLVARIAQDIAFESIYVSSEDIETFFSSTINEFDETPKSRLVYLESGDWLKSQEDASSPYVYFQKTLQLKIEQFDPSNPVIFVTSTSNFADISKDLRKAGYFDRRFIVIKPTLEEAGASFVKLIGEDICSDSFKENLGKIGKLLDIEFDDQRIQGLIALALRRIAKRKARKIEFGDLVYLSTKGSVESDEYPKRSLELDKMIATHEAGHALVAMIDSEGQNFPEYVSIIEAEGFSGIVTDSVSYHLSKHRSRSYSDVRHQVRVLLAGRVAEHVMYGAEKVSVVSASDDLKKATELCFYMFSARGISPDMTTFKGACSNLTVEIEEDKPFDKKRIELLAREYLAAQYKIVFDMINANKSLYLQLVDQLMNKSILDQNDLYEISENYLIPC